MNKREREKRWKRMRTMVANFQKYVAGYSGQSNYEDYSDRTYLDDMLYGIGISMDHGETGYSGGEGYERFKQRLREHLAPPPSGDRP